MDDSIGVPVVSDAQRQNIIMSQARDTYGGDEEIGVDDLGLKIGIMVFIFCISLFAASFPTLSRRISYIRVPRMAFFIGKHFGTGVILSTAFVHLLQDSFVTLLSLTGPLRNWVGLLVLCSLLSIFIVEYVSMAYVERLEGEGGGGGGHHHHDLEGLHEDLPSQDHTHGTPYHDSDNSHPHDHDHDHDHERSEEHTKSRLPPPAPLPISPYPHTYEHEHSKIGTAGLSPMPESPEFERERRGPSEEEEDDALGATLSTITSERTPLLGLTSATEDPDDCIKSSAPFPSISPISPLAHPPSAPAHTRSFTYGAATTTPSPSTPSAPPTGTHQQFYTLPRSHVHSVPSHAPLSHRSVTFLPQAPLVVPTNGAQIFSGHHRFEPRSQHHTHSSRHSRRDSLSESLASVPATVISGMIVSGDLGVGAGESRVSLLVDYDGEPSHEHQYRDNHSHEHEHHDEDVEEEVSEALVASESVNANATANGTGSLEKEKRRQVVSILVLQMGIMLHSLVIGLTLSVMSGPDFTSLVTAISFHQLFEGLSLGIRIASLPTTSTSNSSAAQGKPKQDILSVLKPTLALLFGITTPVGMIIGIYAFPHGSGGTDGVDPLQMLLVRGLMSALSSGMLIYASCIEMLAGDFIMDQQLKIGPVRAQVIALVSLVAGVIGMAGIGFVE